jgi:hypothetical protein
MARRTPLVTTLLLAATFLTATGFALSAGAQTPVQPTLIGTFHWQLQPFCSTLSLTVIQEAGQYRVQGTEACAPNDLSRSVYGTAILDHAGWVYLSLTTPRLQNSFEGTAIYARLQLATLAGAWQDDGGRSGTLMPVPGPIAGTNRRAEVGNAFVHTVQALNRPSGPGENVTCFSHPLTDGRSSAMLQVTVNRGQASEIRPAVSSTLSVYLDNNGTGLPAPLDNNVWCISRDDNQDMPIGAAFNVRVVLP